jgi:hypothetical protein
LVRSTEKISSKIGARVDAWGCEKPLGVEDIVQT